MNTKIGLTIKSIKVFDDYLQADFQTITRAGVTYNKLLAFSEHIDERFEYQFDTTEAYEAWLVDFVYFLIPTDFVSYIEHYSGFVKESFPQLAFNIICEQKNIIVEGVTVSVPTSVVNVIPCSVAHWTDQGIAVLESVIGSWNNQNPTKTIKIPYQFESHNDLIAFRNSNTL